MYLLSVKKKTPSLCTLFSFYKKTPEELADEADKDSHFYHNIFDISKWEHREAHVTKG